MRSAVVNMLIGLGIALGIVLVVSSIISIVRDKEWFRTRCIAAQGLPVISQEGPNICVPPSAVIQIPPRP